MMWWYFCLLTWCIYLKLFRFNVYIHPPPSLCKVLHHLFVECKLLARFQIWRSAPPPFPLFGLIFPCNVGGGEKCSQREPFDVSNPINNFLLHLNCQESPEKLQTKFPWLWFGRKKLFILKMLSKSQVCMLRINVIYISQIVTFR